MRCALLLGLGLLSCAGGTPMPAPSPPASATVSVAPPTPTAEQGQPVEAKPLDPLEAELRWLRERIPALAELRSGRPADELLSWVEEGKTAELWLTAGEFRCAPARAVREADAKLGLRLDITKSEKQVGGRMERELIGGYAGQLLRFGSSGSTEVQAPNGSWTATSGWGSSGGTLAGSLTEISTDHAHYGGAAVRVVLRCPKVLLACQSGGQRACVDCSEIEAHVHRLRSHGAYGVVGKRFSKPTCSDPCPEPDTRDLDRANALLERLEHPWMPHPDSKAATVYRSREVCEAAL